ncbi:MAG: OadG family protein [Oscillospiraceae bacterium]|nr:OadG family protein [Oscillospiraceae bacterium]
MNLMFLANNLLLLAGGSIDGDKRPLDSSERWGVTLAGLGIVLAALVLLIVVIFIFGKIFEAINSNKQKKDAAAAAAKAPKTAPKKTPAPAPIKPTAAVPVKVPDTADDDEVIAVISAVVAMMSEADGTAYRVKSVKPAGGTVMSGRSAWAMDGRRQNVSPF